MKSNRKKELLSHEARIGLLFCVALFLVGAFAYFLGVIKPFSNNYTLYVTYNFAGGLEVGSPVRVSGIKVGKVSSIDFYTPNGADAKEDTRAQIKCTLLVDAKAKQNIRKDSNFYINMAGIIGERYIDISPGSMEREILAANTTIRGVDPPRFDELISQSYGLFGDLQELLGENSATLSKAVKQFGAITEILHASLTQTSGPGQEPPLARLIENFTYLSEDLRVLTADLKKVKAEGDLATRMDGILTKLDNILAKADSIDEKVIRDFLQKEGVKAKISLF